MVASPYTAPMMAPPITPSAIGIPPAFGVWGGLFIADACHSRRHRATLVPSVSDRDVLPCQRGIAFAALRIEGGGKAGRFGSGTIHELRDAMLDTVMLPPYIADLSDLAKADELMADYGPAAAEEAAARANQARDRENVVQFCRWRQLARLVTLLEQPDAWGTIH